MKDNDPNDGQAALLVLRHTGVNVLQAAIFASESPRGGRDNLTRARRCMDIFASGWRRSRSTVSLRRAFKTPWRRPFSCGRTREKRICFQNRRNPWTPLRRRSGYGEGNLRSHDVLQQTFADHFILAYRDRDEFPIDMSLCGVDLFRTRYLSMEQTDNTRTFRRPFSSL